MRRFTRRRLASGFVGGHRLPYTSRLGKINGNFVVKRTSHLEWSEAKLEKAHCQTLNQFNGMSRLRST